MRQPPTKTDSAARTQLVRVVTRELIHDDVLSAAAYYEKRFGLSFQLFAVFSNDALRQLHAPLAVNGRASQLILQRQSDRRLKTLTRVANLLTPSIKDKQAYLYALLQTYRQFKTTPVNDPNVLTIAPKREGTILARLLGWLGDNARTPEMKRIKLRDGLAVGVSDLLPSGHFRSCSIIDGAIASGATAMTIMQMLGGMVDRFDVFTVHATQAGINAVSRHARLLGKPIRIRAGFITGTLNDEYYAVDLAHRCRLVVGDLGDTIANVAGNE